MTTPTWITGLEHGVIASNGGGIFTAFSGSPTIDSGTVRTGNYSLKLTPVGTGSFNARKNTGAVQVVVGRVYIYFASGGTPSSAITLIGWQTLTGGFSAGLNVTSAGVLRGLVGSGSTADGPTLSEGQWYQIDLRLNISASTWTLDWSVDGTPQTQATWAGQATDDVVEFFRLGSSSSTATYSIFIDDVVISETSADYPIGAGGVELIKPDADGSHNAGTNVMEDQAGTDIGTAWSLIDDVPVSENATYIRQAANGAGNYAEVTFSDPVETHTTIQGAYAVLTYASETTSTNSGACIASKDNFSTEIEILGTPSAPVDMSPGTISLANLYYQGKLLTGVNDDTTINNLKARMGYSADASPDPYWVNLVVEVAFSTESSNVTVNVSARALALAGRAAAVLSVVSIPIGAAAIAAAEHAASVLATVSVPVSAGALAGAGRTVSVVPGAFTVPVGAAPILAAARAASVLSTVSIPINAAALAALGRVASVLASVSIPIDAAALAALGRASSVVPGAFSVPVGAAPIVMGAQAATVVPVTQILVDAALLDSLGHALSVVPGSVVVIVNRAIQPSNGRTVTVLAGSVSIPVDAAIADTNGRSVSVISLTSVQLNSAALVAAGRSLSVVPGAVLHAINRAALQVAGIDATVVPGARVIAIDQVRLASEAHALSVLPGARVIPISAAQLAALGLAATVTPGTRLIGLNAAQLVLAGIDATVVPGAFTVPVSAALLASAGRSASVLSLARIPVTAALLNSQGRAVSVVPGAVSVPVNRGQLSLLGLGVDVSAIIVYVTLTLPMYMMTEIKARKDFIE